MLAHAPHRQSGGSRPFGDQAVRWSWYLLLLWFPWLLMGGGMAMLVTSVAEGNFAAGEGVPGFVDPALYVWMALPLIASIAIGISGWLKGHRPAAIAPAIVSAAWMGVVTVLGAEQFVGA